MRYVFKRNITIYICLSFVFYIIVSGVPMEVLTPMPQTLKTSIREVDPARIREFLLNNSRRILMGSEVIDGRPYMVYLKLSPNNIKFKDYRGWLCGGIIVHEEYILTSAACIEDVRHFYVVSGTYKHDEEDDKYTNICIKNGAKKAIWKCVPKNYIFDGHENDNIRWMNNDIAVVKVEDEFDFSRRVRGCDFIPKPIAYNNSSKQLEEPGNKGWIAGWGSTYAYSDWVNRRTAGSTATNLLETYVEIMDKRRCKYRWGRRYHNIIENYMICTKDNAKDLSEICSEKYVDCQDIWYDETSVSGRKAGDEDVHSANHNFNNTRRNGGSGGFCENDHGGPLISGEGGSSIAIGIISACLVKERTNRCYGPFLYTSIYKNRILINCAIYKDYSVPNCNKVFRSGENHEEEIISWADHPDGPAMNEKGFNSTRPREYEDETLNEKETNKSKKPST